MKQIFIFSLLLLVKFVFGSWEVGRSCFMEAVFLWDKTKMIIKGGAFTWVIQMQAFPQVKFAITHIFWSMLFADMAYNHPIYIYIYIF